MPCLCTELLGTWSRDLPCRAPNVTKQLRASPRAPGPILWVLPRASGVCSALNICGGKKSKRNTEWKR